MSRMTKRELEDENESLRSTLERARDDIAEALGDESDYDAEEQGDEDADE